MENSTEITEPKIYNGIFTIENTEKGTHRTFRIATVTGGKGKEKNQFVQQNLSKRIVSLLIGPDNTNSYRKFAWIDDNGIHIWQNARGGQYEALAACLWSMLTEGENSQYYAKGARIRASRHCMRCNRLLTDPTSIRRGLGPECAGLGLWR